LNVKTKFTFLFDPISSKSKHFQSNIQYHNFLSFLFYFVTIRKYSVENLVQHWQQKEEEEEEAAATPASVEQEAYAAGLTTNVGWWR
tara:strand:- start:428 stop:688 length:261 start_codon:yes stop_codon:yes gene_type:complete